MAAAMKAGDMMRQQIWVSKPVLEKGLLCMRMRPA